MEGGNSDVLYDPRRSRGNLPECMDMDHRIASPFLLHFSRDGDLFRCEVLVRRSSASRWTSGDEYGCTRLARARVQPERSPRPESVLGVVVSFRPIPRYWGGHTAVANNDAISLLVY